MQQVNVFKLVGIYQDTSGSTEGFLRRSEILTMTMTKTLKFIVELYRRSEWSGQVGTRNRS